MAADKFDLLFCLWSSRLERSLTRLADAVRAQRQRRAADTYGAGRVLLWTELPDDLASNLHVRAAREGRLSREVVGDALRDYFERVTCP
jgi:hypothetical protein